MTDIATLGLQVDTQDVPPAVDRLNQLTGAAKRAEDAAQGIGSAFNNASAFSRASIEGMAASMAKVANISQKAQYAITNVGNAATRVSNAMNAGTHNAANLAAQGFDIVTTAASGMSAGLIGLQQGLQVAQVAMISGGGFARSLGAAFISMLSPVTLLSVGLTTAAALAIQYFLGVSSSSQTAEDTLVKQEALIGRVADKWGEALPAVKAYNDELVRSKDLAEQAAAVDVVKQDKLKIVNELLEQLNVNMADWRERLQNAGMESVVFDDLQRKLQASAEKLRDGKDESAALASVMGILRSSIEDQSNPALVAMIELLTQLKGAAAKAATAVAAIRPDVQSMTTDRVNPNSAGFVDPTGTFRRPSEFIPFSAPTPGSRPLVELEGFPKIGGGSKQSAYESATRSIIEQTAALKAQNDVQASLNPLVTDYGYSLAKAKATSDLLAAAERDKKTITAELTNEINANATALANQTVIQAKNAEATAAAKANLEAAKSAATGFLSTMRQGLVASEGWWRSFGSAALGVLDKIASAIETQLVNALFNPTAGGFNILSLFLGSTVAGGVSGGSAGASAAASAPVAKMAARLPAARAAANSNAKGAGVHVTAEVSVNENGNWEAKVTDIADKSAGRAAGQVKAGFDAWKRTGQHVDIEKHLKNRRRIG